VDPFDRVGLEKQLGGEEPVQIETDDQIDTVIENKFVPFRHHRRLVGVTPRRVFIRDSLGGPADQAGVAANGPVSKLLQRQAQVPGGFRGGEA
jgi:hypothetical protein